MHSTASPAPPVDETKIIPAQAVEFFRRGMEILDAAGVPFLVGGARALHCYTGIVRHTKDFDVMIRAVDVDRALTAAREAGLESELAFPHWLGKIHYGKDFIDLVFRAGNGLCEVTDSWFEHALSCDVLGRKALICPAEEIIWTKAFILERERYDGGDIAHLLNARAEDLNWSRLLALFGENWRLLLNHLVLFGYIYPGERARVPAGVMSELIGRLQAETAAAPQAEKVCRGTLISRQQYLQDISEWGYRDARLKPEGPMTAEQVAQWTEAIWANAHE